MKNKTLVMISIVLAVLVTSMDTTIINTTMPIIAKELGGFEFFAWTFASYMIFATVLAPVAGRISDLFGRKKVFAIGIVVFLIGSILCGSSQTMLQLVIFRAIQGIGAGIMNPFLHGRSLLWFSAGAFILLNLVLSFTAFPHLSNVQSNESVAPAKVSAEASKVVQ